MRTWIFRTLTASLIGAILPLGLLAQAPPTPVTPPRVMPRPAIPAPAVNAAPAAKPATPAPAVLPNSIPIPPVAGIAAPSEAAFQAATPYNPTVVGRPVPNPAWNRPNLVLPCDLPNQNLAPLQLDDGCGCGWLHGCGKFGRRRGCDAGSDCGAVGGCHHLFGRHRLQGSCDAAPGGCSSGCGTAHPTPHILPAQPAATPAPAAAVYRGQKDEAIIQTGFCAKHQREDNCDAGTPPNPPRPAHADNVPNNHRWFPNRTPKCNRGGACTTCCNTFEFIFGSSRGYFGESSRAFFERPSALDGIKQCPAAYGQKKMTNCIGCGN